LLRFLPPGDLDGAGEQFDHAFVRHLDMHFAYRPALVIGDGFVVCPEVERISKRRLNKLGRCPPRRLFVASADGQLPRCAAE
jgi:hypothetical protein